MVDVGKVLYNPKALAASVLLTLSVVLIVLAVFEVEAIRNEITVLQSKGLRIGEPLPAPSVAAELTGLFALFVAWSVMAWSFFWARRSRVLEYKLSFLALGCLAVAAMVMIPGVVPWMFALSGR